VADGSSGAARPGWDAGLHAGGRRAGRESRLGRSWRRNPARPRLPRASIQGDCPPIPRAFLSGARDPGTIGLSTGGCARWWTRPLNRHMTACRGAPEKLSITFPFPRRPPPLASPPCLARRLGASFGNDGGALEAKAQTDRPSSFGASRPGAQPAPSLEWAPFSGASSHSTQAGLRRGRPSGR
jgi:hypothetical protein